MASRRLRKLLDEAAELGLEEQIADVLELHLAAAKKAGRSYEAFHWGNDSERAGAVLVPMPPPAMWELGPLVKVIYEARKGSRELVHWDHDFDEERPTLAFDDTGDQLWIVGGDYRVNARGIVG